MNKPNKGVLIPVAAGIGGILLIGWLQSNPNCDRGCRTQLQHLKDHVLEDIVKIILSQIGL